MHDSNYGASGNGLIDWIRPRVDSWIRFRDQNIDRGRWDAYERLWRGEWSEAEKTRSSERSKLISPVLSQAVETLVAELEESIFSRELWFDISDDVADPVKDDMVGIRQLLAEDLRNQGVRHAVSAAILNAALFGTGIIKLVPDIKQTVTLGAMQHGGTPTIGFLSGAQTVVSLEAVSPRHFAIDTAATCPGRIGIERALGCAHVTRRPLWEVESDPVFRTFLPDFDFSQLSAGDQSPSRSAEDRKKEPTSPADALITLYEYWGLVPAGLLAEATGEKRDPKRSEELVQARVVYTESGHLLFAGYNMTGLSPFVAFAFDTVPGLFWGRGAAEKAYHAQRANDAIIRAQLDSLAYSAYPMLGVDITKLPPDQALEVGPGSLLASIGPPSEVFQGLRLPSVDPATWSAAADMERLVTVATGAMDTALPLRANRRNETASGMSMLLGQMIKRIRRTLRNIEEDLLVPLVSKAATFYMFLDPVRYPAQDFTFQVRTALGIAAREVEQANLIQLVGMLPKTPETLPLVTAVARAVVEMSDVPNREQLLAIFDKALATPKEPSPQDALATEREVVRIAEGKARIQKNLAQASAIAAKAVQ